MAAKHLSLLLLLTLLSSLHTHARDSQMFNKVIPTRVNENVVVKESTPQVPNKEEPSAFNTKEQEPNFIPDNENSYGLYGHESAQLPPSTTTTTIPNNEPYKGSNFPYNAKYLPKNYNPVAYVTEPEDFNDSSFEDKSYTNGVNKDINDTYDTGMGYNRKKNHSGFKIVDPDEIVDPAALSNYLVSDEDDDDNASEDSDTSSDSSLQPYDLSDDDTDLRRKFSQLVDVVGALRKSDDADAVEGALDVAEKLIRASPDELRYISGDLVRTLVQVRCSDSTVEGEEESAEEKRQKALVALVVTCPLESLDTLNKLLYSPNLDVSQRIMILDIMTDAAQELAYTKISKPENRPTALISSISDQAWFVPRSTGPPGAGPWKEISTPGTLLNWSHSYERKLPAKPGQLRRGKTRQWSRKSSIQENQLEWSQNKFPQYAAAFMLPAMQGFDKKRHGVDLLGRDFIVLGKLIYMLGVCMKCAAMHPEASFLASPLLDMLSSRDISNHKEAYVRRSVLFAASCILVALHPSYVASALTEGNVEISKGLEWVRTWALHVVESDTDRDCYTLAMTCLQLHAELALQASRALESTESGLGLHGVGLPSSRTKQTIRIPH